MKSWFDLSKEEQKELRQEFKKKRKVIDLRVLFYLFAIISFVPIICGIALYIDGECAYDDSKCGIYIFIFSAIMLIFLVLGIINSILITKNQKEFNSWLKFRNIEK